MALFPKHLSTLCIERLEVWEKDFSKCPDQHSYPWDSGNNARLFIFSFHGSVSLVVGLIPGWIHHFCSSVKENGLTFLLRSSVFESCEDFERNSLSGSSKSWLSARRGELEAEHTNTADRAGVSAVPQLPSEPSMAGPVWGARIRHSLWTPGRFLLKRQVWGQAGSQLQVRV